MRSAFRYLAVPALAVALSTAATTAQAQITTYTNQATFLGALGPVTVETFTNSYHFPLGSTLNASSSYTPTSGGPISPGDIQAGVTYSVSRGPLLIDGFGGFEGGFLDGIGSYGTVGPLQVTFAGPVSGFGFLTNDIMGTAFDITINYDGSVYTNSFAIMGEGLQFFGFTSAAENIMSATIGGNRQGINFALDDFTFGGTAANISSVPEPSSFALLAVGVLAMSGVAARRRTRA